MPKNKDTHTTQTTTDTNSHLDGLGDTWQAPLVLRNQEYLDRFSGGLLNARTMANLDCQGLGPKGRIKLGRKVAYPTKLLIEWMKDRLSTDIKDDSVTFNINEGSDNYEDSDPN